MNYKQIKLAKMKLLLKFTHNPLKKKLILIILQNVIKK
jgi:hypothetical protein